jgi:hypothetical protein
MSKLNELSGLNKAGKISLLTALKNGEITTDQLNADSIVIANTKALFLALMVSVAYRKKGEKSPVVFIGEAKILMDEVLKNVKKKKR